MCGNLNLWGGCRVLYPVLVTVQQCCGQDRPACCVRGHSLSTQYRAELFCGCPGTQHQHITSHLSRPDCEDSGHDIAGLLQVVGPGSTQSELHWARRCPCQWEWRAVAPCCCLTCLFSENRNLIMSRWRESCSYHQLSLFFRLLDNRNEMASDHPEQNEGDQENTEQNDLQQIEDLKIQVHTYNSNIHNCAIIHSTPSLCNEILPGPSSACQCWHLIVTPGGSVPVSLDTYLKVTSHESQFSLHWFFNWFVSSGCQRRAHDQASTTGNIIRFNSTHAV